MTKQQKKEVETKLFNDLTADMSPDMIDKLNLYADLWHCRGYEEAMQQAQDSIARLFRGKV